MKEQSCIPGHHSASKSPSLEKTAYLEDKFVQPSLSRAGRAKGAKILHEEKTEEEDAFDEETGDAGLSFSRPDTVSHAREDFQPPSSLSSPSLNHQLEEESQAQGCQETSPHDAADDYHNHDEEEADQEDDDNSLSQAVIEVTEDMLKKIDEEEWEHVNGVYDAFGNWREWHETVTMINPYDDEEFVILPYVHISW